MKKRNKDEKRSVTSEKKERKSLGIDLSRAKNNLVREIVSPRNPPYLNSKSRVRQLSLERDLKTQLGLSKKPGLKFLDLFNWTKRTSNNKISYLDNIYAKHLRKLYHKSSNSVEISKAELQALTSSMEKVLSHDTSNSSNIENPESEHKKPSTSIIATRLKLNENITSSFLDKLLEKKSEGQITICTNQLDNIKSRVYRYSKKP
ncbi:hypothetical protein SteCoe_36996 [Stentor coeruleus]|uniref:Uncharacterized protein n=1 Tax=Stentor coeruleus TaxID=5963 RepID=A0A1R2AP17_9CILI|nr:hypothetical protein SteCoe_36996 [Stentor coeruleus]